MKRSCAAIFLFDPSAVRVLTTGTGRVDDPFVERTSHDIGARGPVWRDGQQSIVGKLD